jgi:TetR/AcrR family transcriptional regulator, cholesterol catabolism regulator
VAAKENYRKIRYEIKKNDILENAAKMFSKKGFEKAALEDIAHELKMTKGSLYYYIKSKEDMLFQCIMKALKMTHDMMDEVEKLDLPPELKLRQVILGHTKVLTTDFVVGVLRQQELLLPKNMRETVIRERDRFEQRFLAILKEGIKKGVFHQEDWKMRAYAIQGALNWIPRWRDYGRLFNSRPFNYAETKEKIDMLDYTPGAPPKPKSYFLTSSGNALKD